uniref:Uncharacterized protein n=1 Tax=Rhizophora mucronata TaxID=61149 RepID=A0A2P2PH32_RHIMU
MMTFTLCIITLCYLYSCGQVLIFIGAALTIWHHLHWSEGTNGLLVSFRSKEK